MFKYIILINQTNVYWTCNKCMWGLQRGARSGLALNKFLTLEQVTGATAGGSVRLRVHPVLEPGRKTAWESREGDCHERLGKRRQTVVQKLCLGTLSVIIGHSLHCCLWSQGSLSSWPLWGANNSGFLSASLVLLIGLWSSTSLGDGCKL